MENKFREHIDAYEKLSKDLDGWAELIVSQNFAVSRDMRREAVSLRDRAQEFRRREAAEFELRRLKDRLSWHEYMLGDGHGC